MITKCLAKYGGRSDMELIAREKRERYGNAPASALDSLQYLAMTSGSETAVLAYLDEVRRQPDLDKNVVRTVCSLDRNIRSWPSKNAKDAYFTFIRELLNRPASRDQAAEALLRGLGHRAYPDIVAVFDQLTPESRKSIIYTIGQTQGDAAAACLKDIRAKTTDPQTRSQIDSVFTQRASWMDFAAKSQLGFQVFPTLDVDTTSVFQWWQLAAVTVVGAIGGSLLLCLRWRRRSPIQAQANASSV